MRERLNTEEFIKRAKLVHGNKYIYDKSVYSICSEKVIITCPKHGDFLQAPLKHVNHAQGCKACYKESPSDKLSNIKEFTEKATEIHEDKYDYSQSVYINGKTKMKIICPKHGDFLQQPNLHLTGRGCTKCGRDIVKGKLSLTKKLFIEKAKESHGSYYDYSKVIYTGTNDKVEIICKKHGSFFQTPNIHTQKEKPCGCPDCAFEKSSADRTLSNEEFIERAKEINGNKYDYSEADYKGWASKVKIFCNHHKKFFHQLASNHLNLGHGCPSCNVPGKKLQEKVINLVKSLKIKYFEDVNNVLKHTMKGKRYRQIDVWIPSHNLGIEVHGNYWHSEFKKDISVAKTHMLEKYDLSLSNDVTLIQVYEDEIIWNFKGVEKLIREKLGRPKKSINIKYCKMFHFKTMDLVSEENSLIREFISKNSNEIIGDISEGIYITKDLDIVGVLYFNESKVLSGYATSTEITGGFSKSLQMYIKSKPNISEILALSDNRFSNDKLLESNKFERFKKVKPSFYYTFSSATRRNCKFHISEKDNVKFKLNDPSLSFHENAILNGYARLWNAGCTLWKLKL